VVCVLAVLDGYYLALERVFRNLYGTAENEGADNWSLKPSPVGWREVLKALVSPSIYIFYGSAIIAAIIVAATS
jgi:hypothetical protein